MELFLDVLSETLVDTAKMLPFLFLAYLFIEYVETRHGERIETLLAGGGRWGAVPGAVLGCVPQCGFSAIASNFYASRVITLGTLMAVYLATSDEAIPLLVSMPAYWDKLILLMVIKVVYAVLVGFLLDFVLRKALPRSLRGGYTGHADEVDCHEEHSDEEGHPQPIWKAALRHTLEIFVFIFVFSLVFGLIVEGVGEDVFAGPDGLLPAGGGSTGGPCPQLCRQRPDDPALRRGRTPLLEPRGRSLHRRGRGSRRAVAGESLLEAEPLHHRPDLGLRRRCGRGHPNRGSFHRLIFPF